MADYSELKRRAQEIKDEVKAGANTANRVGLALEETVKALEAENKRAEQAEESLENAIQRLQDETEDLPSIREQLETLVVNDLTTGGADKALSAEMGKVLSAELTELGKEATIEHKGLMSAKDKKTINTIAGANSEIIFADAEIGTENTFFDFSQPFPVQAGQTYTFSVNLNNSTACNCYLWDGSTNLGYAFFNVGAKSFSFTPDKDGVVRKISLRGVAAFNVEGSISIVLAQRGVATVGELAEVNNKVENIIRKLTVKYNILEGYYAGDTGKFLASSTYICTSLLPCVSGKTYHTPQAFRFTFYDESKSFISAVGTNIGDIPDNAKYVGITYTAKAWNKDAFFFYTDDLNDAIVYQSELNDAIADIKESISTLYYTEFSNNLTNEPVDAIVAEGEYGGVDAVYRIPVRCTGKYVVGIDFKLPSNFNSSTDVLDIFRFESVPKYTRFSGACKTLITCAMATSEYQQPVCNGLVSIFTNTATSASAPIPSGRCEYKGGQYNNAMPFGETAFSVRYAGAANTKSITLDDTGLVIKDNGTIEATIPYPSNKSLVDFSNSVRAACTNGSLVDFECEIYDVFVKSTDDLVRVTDIPLRYTYSYGEDAFPIFFKTIDKKWHRLEVVFDKDGESGTLIEMFVDGNRQKWSNKIPALSSGYSGVFNDYIIIGGSGVEVRNFSFKNNATKISSPRIVVEMLHSIKDEVESGAGGGESQDAGNLICAQEIEGIISTYHRNGYKHISLEEIASYLNGNIELDGKFFCMMHDDDFFVANHPLVEKTYKRYGIKAAFAIINSLMSDNEAEYFKKTSNLFQYTLHHTLGWADIPYSQLCEIMEIDIPALQNRLSTGTNMAIYPGGGHNLAVMRVIESYGISYCGIVGSQTGTTSRANDKMAAPRMLRSLGKYDNLQAEIDSVAKYYD